MVENFCNVIVTKNGTIRENTLFVGERVGENAEKLFVEKMKENLPSGFQYDDDFENEALDNGYVSLGKTVIMLSWPSIKK